MRAVIKFFAATSAVVLLGLESFAKPEIEGPADSGETATPAEQSVRPLRILTIGNSFSILMCKPNALPKAAALAGHPIDFAHLYRGGATLAAAWSYRGDASKYLLSSCFTSDANPLDSLTDTCITNVLKAVDWDVVTLQQASMSSYQSNTYAPHFQNLVSCIRQLAPNARIVWHMTWAYDRYSEKAWDFKGDIAQRDRMFDRIVEAYEANVASTAWKTIPTGYAFQLYRYRLPVTSPRDDFTYDEHQHLNDPDSTTGNPAGNYLETLTWCQALFGEMPTAEDYPPSAYSEHLDLSAEEVARLRQCAQDACQATSYRFYGQGTVDFNWTVTFRDDDGATLAVQSVTNGACAAPPAVTRQNAVLAGWTCQWPVGASEGVTTEALSATSAEVSAKKVYDNLAWTARWVVQTPYPPMPCAITTNALADASWGYEVLGLGPASNEVAIVFTNHLAIASWAAPADLTDVQFLVVGGGGGGGGDNKKSDGSMGGGGGGGGGVVTGVVYSIAQNAVISAKVGAGGTGGKAGTSTQSSSPYYYGAGMIGSSSTLGVNGVTYVTANAGGRDLGAKSTSASAQAYAGGRGGSSAGSRPKVTTRGEATKGSIDSSVTSLLTAELFGNQGGAGDASVSYASGGGGGATEEGGTPSDSSTGGKGGEGLASDITGTLAVYGSGGGGGTALSAGVGGLGGSGAGDGHRTGKGKGENALPNQGGGGGGGGGEANGGDGGSGIVVLRFRIEAVPADTNPTVDGFSVAPADVFTYARTTNAIVYPGTPTLTGAEGSQSISYNGVDIAVPDYYTAALTGNVITLVLNGNAKPVIANTTATPGIAVVDGKVRIHLANVRPTLYYAILTAASLDAAEWTPCGGYALGAADFEYDASSATRFYKAVARDVP